MALICEPLKVIDLKRVTEIHLAAFPKSALTQLGKGAVQRYYDWLVTGPHPRAFNIGAWEEGQLAGFCCGGKFNGALSGFLRKNRAYLTWRVITHPWLVRSPLFQERLHRVWDFFRNQSASGASPAPQSTPPSFGILAIATHPQYQGRGVGRFLMETAENAARQHKLEWMNLSVATDNQQAIRFYEGLGWVKTPESDGTWDGHMRKYLEPEAE